ncbi:hypothetical protein JI435_039020, partial [Parastagonospora nodorum SN15]
CSEIQILRRNRTNSFSMLGEADFLKERFLEPIPGEGVIRNMADVLLGVCTPTAELMSPVKYGDARTLCSVHTGVYGRVSHISLDRWHYGSSKIRTLVILLLPFLDISAYKSLKLTSRVWYCTLNLVAPPRFPASHRIPIEIIQHIFNYLHPREFNAARHTCRCWMRASLDKGLLSSMLERGGWSSGAIVDLKRKMHTHDTHGSLVQSKEWLLSQYLSRQCALACNWTGNGLDNRPAVVESTSINCKGFLDGHGSSARIQSTSLIFSASTCGRFVLFARDTLIYIYDTQHGFLIPVASVICPRRVISMSMDVSYGRHAVAALLEGRMGMIYELHHDREGQPEQRRAAVTSHGEKADGTAQKHLSGTQERELDSFQAIDVHSHNEHVGLEGLHDQHSHDRNLITSTWNLNMRSPSKDPVVPVSRVGRLWRQLRDHSSQEGSCSQIVPIGPGTSTFYRHLCSEDDPPRSVSICPQRRCVAFGCSAGIELHWIDALTDQSLSR